MSDKIKNNGLFGASMTAGEVMLCPERLEAQNFSFSLENPFGIFEIDDVLTEGSRLALDQGFPGPRWFHDFYNNGNKHYLDNTMSGFFDFLETSSAWYRLYRQFAAPALIEKLYALSRYFPSARPAHETLPWTLVIDPDSTNPTRDAATKCPLIREKSRAAREQGRTAVRVAFEFSHLQDGGFVAPHTDVPPKLISLMLYFPDAGVNYGPDAGTVFYTGHNSRPAEPAWEVFMLEPEPASRFFAGHEVFHRAPFVADRLIGFVKSDISWHGLEPVKLPAGATRRSININYFCV